MCDILPDVVKRALDWESALLGFCLGSIASDLSELV